MTSYKIISYSTNTVVSVSQLKQQLQIFEDGSYDSELSSILLAAQDLVAGIMGKPICDTVVVQPLKAFDDFEFSHETISDVAVKYFNTSNQEVALAETDYILDETGVMPRIVFKKKPVLSSDYQTPVAVQYTAKPGSVEARVKHAVLIAAYELFHNRGESVEGSRSKAAITINRLIGSNKRWVV